MASNRIMRAFTLARSTAEALDQLTKDGEAERLRILLPEPDLPVHPDQLLDDCSLAPEDYEALYALLPKKANPFVDRTNTNQAFMLHLNYCSGNGDLTVPQIDAILRAMNKRITTRRREAKKLSKKPPKATPINVSRIADALIILGLSALQERVPVSEAATGSRSNAKEGRNKLSIGGGRKDSTVRSIRGGA